MRGDEEEIRKNAKATRLVVYAVIAIWIVILWSACHIIDAYGGQKFIEEYFVTGVNEQTGERVIGWIDGELGGDEVQGTILDRQGQFVVIGRTTGCGQFELRSLCCTYDVQVADEVTDDKIANRKQWQESWK